MKSTTPIYKWGIEVEAGWKQNMNYHTKYYIGQSKDIFFPWTNDGCILNFKSLLKKHPKILSKIPHYSWAVYGDGCSPNPAELVVYPPADDRELLKKDLRLIYEMIKRIDASCGLHIHTSFRDSETYYRLLSKEYILSFQDKVVSAFPETKDRLRGGWAGRFSDDSYFKWDSDSVTNRTYIPLLSGSKSTCLSYQYGSLGTLEYRVFPGQTDLDRVDQYLDFLEVNVAEFLKLPEPKTPLVSKETIQYNLEKALLRNYKFWSKSKLRKVVLTQIKKRVKAEPKSDVSFSSFDYTGACDCNVCVAARTWGGS